MSYTLGISAYYHDSASAIVKNGEIIAAAQEERFTRKKHDSSLPKNAIKYCLYEANIKPQDLSAIVFYEKPLLKFERLLETTIATVPTGAEFFKDAMPSWLQEKLFIPNKIESFFKKELNCKSSDLKNCQMFYTTHHEAHQASAFYPSPYEKAAILCMDGVGEWDCTSWGVGDKENIEIKQKIEFPHSLGLLYSTFTGYLGFKVNSGEYKLMGLAPYGEAKYKDLILENLLDLKDDGSFWLNQKYFGYLTTKYMYSNELIELFKKEPRKSEDTITQKDMDIARSIQEVTNEIVVRIAKNIKEKTNLENLCLAGGCALNCCANAKIIKEKIFKNIWIQPASGDAGGALGAALKIEYKIFNNKRIANNKNDFQKGSLLGPKYSDEEILKTLEKYGAIYKRYEDEKLAKFIAKKIDNGKIIGYFQGRMEYGPRALGSRSILADARKPEMQKKLNLAIKKRESFRPFAPSCLEEDLSKYFAADVKSPYMLITAQINNDIKKEIDRNLKGLDKLKQELSTIPAVTHVDYSARLQSVSKETNVKYWSIINEFKKLTNCSVIINTSFNVRGEPIVCTPEDAFKCFMFTNIDILVLENYVLLKEEQTKLDGFEEYQKSLIKD